jgi:hypothetical protein
VGPTTGLDSVENRTRAVQPSLPSSGSKSKPRCRAQLVSVLRWGGQEEPLSGRRRGRGGGRGRQQRAAQLSASWRVTVRGGAEVVLCSVV